MGISLGTSLFFDYYLYSLAGIIILTMADPVAEDAVPPPEAAMPNAAVEPQPDIAGEIQHVPDERLQSAVWELLECKTANIYTYGMGCSGKSSIVRELLGPKARKKPKVESGAKPVTLRKETYEIPVGDVVVNVCDTPGMFALNQERRDKETINDTAIVWLNDRFGGVLLVCIPMHTRMDKSTMQLIAHLSNNDIRKEIWQYVIVVLTKADEYPEREWLVNSRGRKSRLVLSEKFKETLDTANEELKAIFTSPDVGLTEKEFLSIPILPTSQYTDNPIAMKKMEQVGFESWFDVLLLQCCKKDHGLGLLNIHKDRLANLRRDALVNAGYPAHVAGKLVPFIQKRLKEDIGYLALIMQWKIYFKLVYSKRLIGPSPFELSEYEKGQQN